MYRLRPGKVIKIEKKRSGLEEALVQLDGGPEGGTGEEKAINYPSLTGHLQEGDSVILNTTAVRLNLGTGGRHFVFYNYRYSSLESPGKGHIMKLRYTPYQVKVLSCEEEESPFREHLDNTKGLNNIPVLTGELHSMLAPAAATIKYLCPGANIVYVMTDGAALPASFSETVSRLKDSNLLSSTITAGHAFGGDLESVNIYTGLLAAREILGADVIIITMGPGTVGTGTRYGFTGIEQGEIINAVNILEGSPVAILRISFGDSRLRHQGISHHSLTVLGEIAQTSAAVCLPSLDEKRLDILMNQLEENNVYARHNVIIREGLLVEKALHYYGLEVKTMGRTLEEDRVFFEAVGSAAIYAAELLREDNKFLLQRGGE